tara:strand:+ start:583 stop:873 length:291 start_codon:yes stop_codon:yes gene_type:complete
MKLKTTRNNLLKYINTPFDGQDYETVAHLIAGNQLIAAANFIDRLDTIVRDTMKIVIMNTCPKISLEMFGTTSFYGDDEDGTWSEFAEEGLTEGGQ